MALLGFRLLKISVEGGSGSARFVVLCFCVTANYSINRELGIIVLAGVYAFADRSCKHDTRCVRLSDRAAARPCLYHITNRPDGFTTASMTT
jgi:hypothetical protein